jgi:hypothetical protein
MTNKPTTPHDGKKQAEVGHPGMMGDGNKEVDAAFGKQRPAK